MCATFSWTRRICERSCAFSSFRTAFSEDGAEEREVVAERQERDEGDRRRRRRRRSVSHRRGTRNFRTACEWSLTTMTVKTWVFGGAAIPFRAPLPAPRARRKLATPSAGPERLPRGLGRWRQMLQTGNRAVARLSSTCAAYIGSRPIGTTLHAVAPPRRIRGARLARRAEASLADHDHGDVVVPAAVVRERDEPRRARRRAAPPSTIRRISCVVDEVREPVAADDERVSGVDARTP